MIFFLKLIRILIIHFVKNKFRHFSILNSFSGKIKDKANNRVFEFFHNQIIIYLNSNRMNFEKFFRFKFLNFGVDLPLFIVFFVL